MKIGLISDTHGQLAVTRQALSMLDHFHVGLTIHCGDIGPEVLALFDGRRAHFVAGNTDDPRLLRMLVSENDHTFYDEIGTLDIEGCRIAFLHGHDTRLLQQTISSGNWDLVCHGHTHAFSSGRQGSTMVVNPGALSRTNYPSVAIVELPSLEVTEVPL